MLVRSIFSRNGALVGYIEGKEFFFANGHLAGYLSGGNVFNESPAKRGEA